jgi:hypothetical protein
MANIMFMTSISGVAEKLLSSSGSEIILDFVLLFLSGSLPDSEFRHSCSRPLYAALGFITSLSSPIP